MADEPKKKKQKRLADFFAVPSSSKTTQNTSITTQSTDSDPMYKKSPSIVNEKSDDTERSESQPQGNDSARNKPTAPKYTRDFNDSWLKKYPWLRYENNQMTCDICIHEGKDNPFTSGCKNFRHSTLVRHASSIQHRASLESQSLRTGMKKQTLDLVSKKNDAVAGAMRCVYWLGKEQLPTIKYKSLLDLHRQQGCTFPDDLQAGGATYTSYKSAEEMQDVIRDILREATNDILTASPYVSILLDESCDISVTKKLLLYAKTVSNDFDVDTHFVDNVRISDGKAETIFSTVKNVLNEHNISYEKVVAVGSDGASVMTGSKNGFVALVKKYEFPFVIGVHCMAHRLALCSSQAADKVLYLKGYQQILSDIFYYFKRSALRREKIKGIQAVLEEPQLQYKELHSVRWFSMYAALEAVYRTWASLATYFETQMVETNDSASKGFFKKMTSFVFIAVTYLLMDIIPKVTQLSLFLQKETIDIAMIRPTVDSVIQQLTWLKTNNGSYLTEFMSVASEGTLAEFKGIHITDTLVQRQQFQKVKSQFLSSLISEIEKRFPAVATDIISNMAVLCLRGLSLLSEDDRREYGNSQIKTLIDYYGVSEGNHAPFIDETETLLEWEKCKDVVVQQRYPCHTVQSTWKLLATNHPDTFPNLTKLAMVAVLAPLQTATVERGFSVQNNIKVVARNRLSSDRLNTLMQISLGPPIGEFDFDRAVSMWKKSKERRLFSKKKTTLRQ